MNEPYSPLDNWGVLSLYGCDHDDECMNQCQETLLLILPDENLKTSGRQRTATFWATVNDQPALCFYSMRICKVSGDAERRHSSRSQQLASLVLLLDENLKTSGNEERQRPSENERPASFVLSLRKHLKTWRDEERRCSGNSERPASTALTSSLAFCSASSFSFLCSVSCCCFMRSTAISRSWILPQQPQTTTM